MQKIRIRFCGWMGRNVRRENLRAICMRQLSDGGNLFTYLDIPGMRPTKNHAEQSLRKPVLFQNNALAVALLKARTHLRSASLC